MLFTGEISPLPSQTPLLVMGSEDVRLRHALRELGAVLTALKVARLVAPRLGQALVGSSRQEQDALLQLVLLSQNLADLLHFVDGALTQQSVLLPCKDEKVGLFIKPDQRKALFDHACRVLLSYRSFGSAAQYILHFKNYRNSTSRFVARETSIWRHRNAGQRSVLFPLHNNLCP